MQEKEKPNGFVFLPKWLIETKLLTAKQKYFCLILAYHRNNQTKKCNPGIPLICLETGLCERTIRTYRKKLTELGIIRYTPGTDKKNRAKYKLNWLDGSNKEIIEIKKLFTSHQLRQISTRLTTANKQVVTTANKQVVTTANEQGGTRTKRTIKKRTTTGKKTKSIKKPAAVSSLSQKIKPKNQTLPPGVLEYILPMFNDTGWHTLNRQELSELILIAIEKGKSDIPNYFRYWKKEIDKKKSIHNPPGYLIRMVKQGNNPPLYEDEKTVGRGIESIQHYRPGKYRKDDKYRDLYEK